MEDKFTTFHGRIIIVHDSGELSEKLKSWLLENHYLYKVVSSVEEANRLMKTGKYDQIMKSEEFHFIERRQ